MITTYNAGLLAAQLKLTLLASINGLVIREDLQWQLCSLASNKIHTSDHGIALFSVAEGEYIISATYQSETLDFGQVKLLKNTRTDMVFILSKRTVTTSDDYFSDYDPIEDHARRQQERNLQSDRHGFAEMPLRQVDNQSQGELGSGYPPHPLLTDAKQFDGVPPNIRPDPSENTEALQLTLAHKLAAAPSAATTPSLSRV